MAEARINPDGRLKGRVALVTGASRGIGEAIAVRLAMEGAKVVCTARTAQEGDSQLPGALDATVQRIRKAGGEAAFIRADLTDAADRERLVQETTKLFGPVDILVNNAFVTWFLPVMKFTEKRMKLMMEVGVYAPVHLAQLVLPAMRERGRGWIINISSGAAQHPKPGVKEYGGTVYGMVKAALERFTTGLAAEVGRHGVAVNVISPGRVATPGLVLNGGVTEANRDELEPVEVIAEAVLRLALADPQASNGRIERATPFLEAEGLTPAALV